MNRRGWGRGGAGQKWFQFILRFQATCRIETAHFWTDPFGPFGDDMNTNPTTTIKERHGERHGRSARHDYRVNGKLAGTSVLARRHGRRWLSAWIGMFRGPEMQIKNKPVRRVHGVTMTRRGWKGFWTPQVSRVYRHWHAWSLINFWRLMEH